ncbi:unnamed protein product, partial [Rotaria sp. Silwood2]
MSSSSTSSLPLTVVLLETTPAPFISISGWKSFSSSIEPN